jgi:c-di-GMP-binding flagellar brake protein YcgR
VASTQNTSEGGVGLVLDRPLEEGATIKLNLFLTEDGIEDPDEEPLVVKASIVWTAEQDGGVHSAGVRFAQLSPDQAQQVQRFLSALGS